jgi:hypothetical protein
VVSTLEVVLDVVAAITCIDRVETAIFGHKIKKDCIIPAVGIDSQV